MRYLILILLVLLYIKTADAGIGKEWHFLALQSSANKTQGNDGGEGFQMTQQFSWSPTNTNTVYCVVDTQGVWKSEDNGVTWVNKQGTVTVLGGDSIEVDPLNENVVFYTAMTGQAADEGIYLSLDGGETWAFTRNSDFSRNSPVGEGDHFTFDTDSFNGTRCMTVYCGTQKDGLLRSTDGGYTWTAIGLPGQVITDVQYIFDGTTTPGVYCAVQGDQLTRVVDNDYLTSGTTTYSYFGTTTEYPRTFAIDDTSMGALEIYCAVGVSKLRVSTDNGSNFASSTAGLWIGNASDDCTYQCVEISPADPDVLYMSIVGDNTDSIGQNDPFYTTNGGTSWNSPSDLDVNNEDVAGITHSGQAVPVEPHPTDSTIALAHLLTTQCRTTDSGDNWTWSANGYRGARRPGSHASVVFSARDKNKWVYACTDFGPFMTEDGGDTFRKLSVNSNSGVTTDAIAMDPTDDTHMVAMVGDWDDQKIEVTYDNGDSWSTVGTETYEFVWAEFDPNNPQVVYSGFTTGPGPTNGSYISRDGGATWELVHNIRAHDLYADSSGTTVYAVEDEGATSKIYISTDEGRTWNQQASGVAYDPIRDMYVDPKNVATIYAATQDELIKSTDSGGTWSEIGIANGITQAFAGRKDFRGIAVDPFDTNIVYAGLNSTNSFGYSEKYIYMSPDGGTTWVDIGKNIPGASWVWCLSVHPYYRDLHMCTGHGNYILYWEPELTVLGLEQPTSEGLVGYWPFEEGSGVSISDLSGYGNHGTITGASWTTGQIGNALDFDGIDDDVTIDDPPGGELDFGTDSFSISLWVYPESNVGSADTPLYKGSINTSTTGWGVFLGSDIWTFGFTDGTNNRTSQFSDSPLNNQWSHLAVVCNRTINTNTLYLNGAQVDEDDISGIGSVSNSLPLTFGTTNTGSFDYDGIIDEVRIYNRALNDQEILNIYNNSPNTLRIE